MLVPPIPGRSIVVSIQLVGPVVLNTAVSQTLEQLSGTLDDFEELSIDRLEGDPPGSMIRFSWSLGVTPLTSEFRILIKGARSFQVLTTATENFIEPGDPDFELVVNSFEITLPASAQPLDTSAVTEELLDAVVGRVVAVRNLAPPAMLENEFISRQTFQETALEELVDEEDLEELEREKDLCVVLDLCSEADDLLKEFLDVANLQVLGFYDPEEKSFTVVSDSDTLDIPTLLVYAHEYTHALQDSHYDLSALEPPEDTFDATKALAALVKGDANLTEYLFFETLAEDQQATGAELMDRLRQEISDSQGAPRYVTETFGWEHANGPNFAFRLYLEGGFDAIDEAFMNIPMSTEQILHPEKYLADEQPRVVTLPELTPVLGGTWSQRDTGVMGEALIGIYLGTFISQDQADAAASGWGGDRYELLKDDQGRRLMAIKFSWDTLFDATEFFDAYVIFVDEKSQGEWELVDSDSNSRLWVGDGISVFLSRDRADTLVIIGPDRAAVDAVLVVQHH